MDPVPKFPNTPDSPKLYSKEFQDLISDETRLRDLVEGSHLFTTPWDKDDAIKGWEEGRRFISQAIDRDGSLLDYGCANGFLLRCLQEWSSHKLDVYGIDTDEEAIEKAKKLFPNTPNNFTTPQKAASNSEYPREFDMIYWNVWQDSNFEDPQHEELLKKLIAAVKKSGRLILGFYETKEENEKAIEQLRSLGYVLSGVLKNPNGGEDIIAWIDKAD